MTDIVGLEKPMISVEIEDFRLARTRSHFIYSLQSLPLSRELTCKVLQSRRKEQKNIDRNWYIKATAASAMFIVNHNIHFRVK